MLIHTTTEPMTPRDVLDLENHPHLREGDLEHGVDIVFENEANRQAYMDQRPADPKIAQGTDTDDCVTEG